MDYTTYKYNVWNTCMDLFKAGIDLGLRFAADGKREAYHSVIPTREELAVKSRYLHRGFYCPSPAFHLIVTNAQRGKILVRPTRRSKVAHRYLYNAENGIYYIESFSNERITSREYIEWHGNRKYGFSYNADGVLGGICVETYHENRLQSYMWARCHNLSSAQSDWQADYVRYETYEYDDRGLSGVNLHFVALIEEEYRGPSDALNLVDLHKYRPVYENGQLIAVW